MRFFTKEWYLDTILAEMCFQLNTSSKAAVYSDKLFESLLYNQKKYFFKERKRIAKYNKEPFDAVKTEADFDANYKENLEYVKSNLPEEILSRVADIRVLALGTAEYDVAQSIIRFCGQVNRRCEAVKDSYSEELEQLAAKIGWYKINTVDMIRNAPIIDISNEENGSIIIRTSAEYTDFACKVTLSNGKIITKDDNILASAANQIELIQLEDGNYEFNLLCLDLDGNTQEFSAVCSDFEAEEIIEQAPVKH